MGWPGPLTALQHLCHQEWLRQQWNRPSRADHYAMQIARELIWLPGRVFGREPSREERQELDLAIQFTFGEAKESETQAPPAPALTDEQRRLAMAKVYLAENSLRLGGDAMVVKLTRAEWAEYRRLQEEGRDAEAAELHRRIAAERGTRLR